MSLVKRFLALLVLVAAACPPPASATPQTTPTAVVDALHNELLQVMQSADALGKRGRFDRLQPTIVESYNLERMMQVAAGAYWNSASEEERKQLVDAFTRYTVSIYAARFNGYSGERFETIGEREGPRQAVLVDTQLVLTEGAPVRLTYVLTNTGDHWRIIDVIVDNKVSELALRKAEYGKILANGGPPALAETLTTKADEFLAD